MAARKGGGAKRKRARGDGGPAKPLRDAPVFCPNCSDAVSELDRFCPACGTLLSGGEEE